MVILMVLLTIAVFALVDLGLRLTLRRIEEKRLRRERHEALDQGLRLEFADEAKSLKRVEVPDPKARILAVDDEPVVLDGFRKILVLAGYSVDTVESGQEALSLVRQNEYDFVFTDLKMPGMDGLDVTKAVHHLRPDVDIAIITGFATVETAVDAMRFGAVDYVQKPFTEDELVDFANRLRLRREDRMLRLAPPEIRLVTPHRHGTSSPRVVNVPGGIYVSPEHTWVRVEMTGEARIGLDDFFQKSVGPVAAVRLPEPGLDVRRGEPLFTVRVDGRELEFASPLTGKVVHVHHDLDYALELMRLKPYDQGWICTIDPETLTADLSHLTIGADALERYQADVRRFTERLGRELAADDGGTERASATDERERRAAAHAFAACFLASASSPGRPATQATAPAGA